MAKGEKRGWRKYVPSAVTVVKVAVALSILRVITRYVVLPYQAKLPAIVRDNWPTPS
jgi:hypothetical protein